MNGLHSREQKRELISILLDSEHYLDLGLVERKKLLCFLIASFFTDIADSKQKAA